MEADGLVVRTRDPQNRRTHQVELTDAGRAQFFALLEVVQAFDGRLRQGFTADQMEALRGLLGRLAANAGTPTTDDKDDKDDKDEEERS
jgi:MarR family transcriptional regulator for hemolysin